MTPGIVLLQVGEHRGIASQRSRGKKCVVGRQHQVAAAGNLHQTRGVQSGEADRHAVWLTANDMEPRLSPFDPDAILDEIQRLVPGYDLMRLQLLSGNDQHLSPAATVAKDSASLVQISSRRDLVLPANDTLFTSGTLGRYSAMLTDLQQNDAGRHPIQNDRTAAD